MSKQKSGAWFGSPIGRTTTIGTLRVLHEAATVALESGADGALSLAEIARLASISRPTAEEAVTELTERGLAAEVENDPDAPKPVGRPAKRYRFASDIGHVLAVDIGIHKVLAVCCDLSGDVRGTHRIEVSPEISATERIAAAKDALKRAARSAKVRLNDVLAVGVGTTGVVDPASGKVALSEALPGWSGVDLRSELSDIGNGEVFIGNDSKLAALAEHWRGCARDTPDVVYILAGHRISVGILIDGRVREGRNGAAGEIGVMKAAGWYAARDTLASVKTLPPKGFNKTLVNNLATGIAATVLTIDPDKVVIGGGLSRAGETLLAPLRRRIHELCLFPVPVEASILGEECVALGAARLALGELENRLFNDR